MKAVKWYLNWIEEVDEEGNKVEHELWVNTWEEVVGHVNTWMSKSSDIIKGEVVCYWGDTPYGNPCLTYNIRVEENE